MKTMVKVPPWWDCMNELLVWNKRPTASKLQCVRRKTKKWENANKCLTGESLEVQKEDGTVTYVIKNCI